MQSLLTGHGIQPTAQRLRIAELLFARAQHMTAEQVIQTPRRDGAQASKATVYNTPNLFAERGLLIALCVDAERGLFDSNTGPHHHIHVENTGELIDVPPGGRRILAPPAAAARHPADLDRSPDPGAPPGLAQNRPD